MAGPDTTDPTLTSAILPSVDVTSAGETVTFTVGAFDTGSGVDRVYLYFDHGWEGRSGLESVVTLADAVDSFSDGQSAASVYFGLATTAGTYGIISAFHRTRLPLSAFRRALPSPIATSFRPRS